MMVEEIRLENVLIVVIFAGRHYLLQYLWRRETG